MFPTKILVIKLRSMGDTVLLTAPLIELNRAFSQAKIHTVISENWACLLEGVPGLQKMIPYHRAESATGRARAIARLAFQLRKEKYDCVINFHASPSSAALALATGAKTRSIHFHDHHAKNRYSTVVVPGKGTVKPVIERDMDTIRALGLHVPAGRTPRIFLQPSEVREAQALLKQFSLDSPILGINLGASRPTKTWSVERWATLALEWCQKEKGDVLAIAGPTEMSQIQLFLKAVDDLLSTIGGSQATRAQLRSRIKSINAPLTLRQLAAVLSQLAVLATGDSGPKHMAVAVDTPTVTLFGPEHPFEWHPYSKELHPYFFIDHLACRKDAEPTMPAWCGLYECVIEENKCLKLIGVNEVLTQAQAVAKRKAI